MILVRHSAVRHLNSNDSNGTKGLAFVFHFYNKVTKPMTMIFHTHDQYGILFDPCKLQLGF